MSKEEKQAKATEKKQYISSATVFDHTKSIDIKINTSWITALQRAVLYIITNLIEDASELPTIFKKFDILMQHPGDKPIEDKEYLENPITEFESMLYTVWYLSRIFKGTAIEQGCILKDVEETKVTMDDFQKVLAELKDTDKDVFKNQDTLQKMFQEKLDSLS